MRRVVPRRRHRRRFATTKANEARVTRCVGVRRQPEGAGLVFFRRRRERRRCRPQRRLRARRCPTPVERGAALACAGVVDEGRGDALRPGGGAEARDDATGRRDVVIALHVERHERRCDERRRAMGGDAAPQTSRAPSRASLRSGASNAKRGGGHGRSPWDNGASSARSATRRAIGGGAVFARAVARSPTPPPDGEPRLARSHAAEWSAPGSCARARPPACCTDQACSVLSRRKNQRAGAAP